ncbi:type VI secretion system amidase effector protein Tae4 [Litorimonas haliclonae]|uniref:type VI secretion system amidase effector protein Tae4 n=1 Tax=Litorimonas haliclonae TaxID=2081977 RepID=UPI0039EFD755
MKNLCLGIATALTLAACETLPQTVAKTEAGPSAQTPAMSQPRETPVTAPVESEKPKYKKLVYGAEMPLVCSKPIAADGHLEHRPNLQVMWENYLYDRPEGIWGEIGGLVEVNGTLPFDQGRWTNACAVRVSYMLNKAGHKIPRERPKTVSGGNKDQYYYRIADMETYLTKTYGKPDLAITDGSANSFDLPNAAGIVLMDFPNSGFTGHVTIWNGAGTVDGANIGGYRVLFWSLPCFLPEGRNQTPIVAQESAVHTASP